MGGVKGSSLSARQMSEDPYENHRFFVNNKASKSVMKLIAGTYNQTAMYDPPKVTYK